MFNLIRKKLNRRNLKDDNYAFLFDDYKGKECVVFDTETTGLNTKKDEILSIGAVTIKDNKILSSQTFEVFLKPSNTISEKSITIHNIRPCDLDNALEPHKAIHDFLHYIGSKPLVGYYLEFDIKMINRYIKPWLGIVLPNKATEVSAIYFDKKISLIPQGNIDLGFDTIMRDLNIPNMGKHNAVNDAIMTAMMYLKLQRWVPDRRY
ncbi:MAG: DNA polymerase III subunit epsilon [Arcobacter sp.]|nr:MAG: DNA polymerase III subunit epsilon [Arcobacter sp.]